MEGAFTFTSKNINTFCAYGDRCLSEFIQTFRMHQSDVKTFISDVED